MDTKPCFRCGETKPLSDFYKHKMMGDGHLGKCKECTKRDVRRRYEENREAINAYDQMRNRLPHRIEREKRRNAERTAARVKKPKKPLLDPEIRRKRNAEQIAKKRKENPEKYREATRRWAKENPEKIRVRQAAYRKAHPELKRACESKRRAKKRNVSIGDEKEISKIYARAASKSPIRCYLCHKTVPHGKRHVDHVIPLAKGGPHASSNLAIACAACNMSKHDKPPQAIGLLL